MRHIYLDLDDTLIQTQHLFEKYKRACANFILIQKDSDTLTVKDVFTLFNEREAVNMPLYGYENKRFITSWQETYRHFIPGGFGDVTIGRLAEGVFTSHSPLTDEALDLLNYLKCKGHPMTVITCGVEAIQMKRIKDVGIEHYFEAIEIVPRKDALIMADIVQDKQNSVMIGNSVRSDINPSTEIGIPAIKIEAPNWAYDEVDILNGGEVYYGTLADVPYILSVIESTSQKQTQTALG